MRIVVTGAAGFIGFHVAQRLLLDGHDVLAVDNFSTGRVENIADLKKVDPNKFKFHHADISNADQMTDLFWAFSEYKPIDVVIHQAALGSVPRSITNPSKTTLANVLGFQNVIHAAQLVGVERFVYASSSSVYGAKGENTSPYALSKLHNEMIAKMYSDLYGMETVGLRYFNVFGPRQMQTGAYAAVIPKFIRLISEGNEIEIHGKGNQSRDFTYIENVVEANVAAAFEDVPQHSAMDIGCGETASVNEIAEMISRLTGKELKIKYGPERLGDAVFSRANIETARMTIGYEPEITLPEGLKRTVSDYARTFSN